MILPLKMHAQYCYVNLHQLRSVEVESRRAVDITTTDLSNQISPYALCKIHCIIWSRGSLAPDQALLLNLGEEVRMEKVEGS